MEQQKNVYLKYRDAFDKVIKKKSNSQIDESFKQSHNDNSELFEPKVENVQRVDNIQVEEKIENQQNMEAETKNEKPVDFQVVDLGQNQQSEDVEKEQKEASAFYGNEIFQSHPVEPVDVNQFNEVARDKISVLNKQKAYDDISKAIDENKDD